MTDAGRAAGPTRRAVLRTAGSAALGVAAVAATGSAAAQSEAPAPEDYGGILQGMDGSGSDSDPYVITDVTELQAVNGDLEASYTLGSDVDASATSNWNDGKGFDPLGTWEQSFTGSFDGGAYVVTGLTIERPDRDNTGLFFEIPEGTTVERVGLEGLTVTGKRYTGGLAGLNAGQVSQCFTRGEVTANGTVAGGLVAQNLGTVSTSYSTASVAGERRGIAGLVGTNNDGSTVTSSYAAGSVPDGTGGVVGSSANDSTVENSYWNSTAISFAAGTTAGTSLTEAEMKGEAAANSMTKLDFENTWRTVTDPKDFPQLQWVPKSSGSSSGGGSGDGDSDGGSDGGTSGSSGDGGSDTTPGGSGPGFGVGSALAGIAGAGYLLKERFGGHDG